MCKRNLIKKILLEFCYYERRPLADQIRIANANLNHLGERDVETIYSELLFMQGELYQITRTRLPRFLKK